MNLKMKNMVNNNKFVLTNLGERFYKTNNLTNKIAKKRQKVPKMGICESIEWFFSYFCGQNSK